MSWVVKNNWAKIMQKIPNNFDFFKIASEFFNFGPVFGRFWSQKGNLWAPKNELKTMQKSSSEKECPKGANTQKKSQKGDDRL